MHKNGKRYKTLSVCGHDEIVEVQKWICSNGHTETSVSSDISIMKTHHDDMVLSIMKNGYQETSRQFNVSRHYLYGLYNKWMETHKFSFDVYPEYMAIFSANLSGSDRYFLMNMQAETVLDIVSSEEELFQTFTNDINIISIDMNAKSKELAYRLSENVMIARNVFTDCCRSIILKKFKRLCHELYISPQNNYNLTSETFFMEKQDYWPDDIIALHECVEWLQELNDNPPCLLHNIYQTWKTELLNGLDYPEFDEIWEAIYSLTEITENKKPQRKWEINKGFLLHYNSEERYDNGVLKGIYVRDVIERVSDSIIH